MLLSLMNKPKLILFDFGGVLVDYSQSFVTASREQNIPIEYLDNAFDNNEDDITRGKIKPQDIYKIAVKESGVQVGDDYDFTSSWVRDYIVIEAAYDLLVTLSKNYFVGILSNIYKGILERSIKIGKLPNIEYNYIFESCEISYKKPEIGIYRYVEERTGLEGSEILFIDDRQDFIDGAKELNWGTFLFNSLDPIAAIEQLRDKYKL
jgi:FMN phosphatase YigB (HAD superfamily)